MNNLITAGELAKLAGTTKRTVLWYDQKGVLTPKEVSTEGIRLYSENQVLDYQKVLLLTDLGVSLKEIKEYLDKKGSIQELFEEKQQFIKSEIGKLNFSLKNIQEFSKNIKSNGTMIMPEIKVMKPFEVYYIERIGSYVKIGDYCSELAEMFSKKGKKFTTLSIFENPTYSPKKSKIKVSVLVKPGMVVKKEYKDIVKKMEFNPGKIICYMHKGSGSLLSFFWKELEKYCALHDLTIRKDIPDFEIYHNVSDDDTKTKMEIFLPIK